jgi:hypothetical protein
VDSIDPIAALARSGGKRVRRSTITQTTDTAGFLKLAQTFDPTLDEAMVLKAVEPFIQ